MERPVPSVLLVMLSLPLAPAQLAKTLDAPPVLLLELDNAHLARPVII